MKNPTNRNSIYHSGQVKVEKRFGQGGSISAAYTWSKLISDTDTLTGWLEPGGGAGGVQNHYNIRAERSLALYDTPHRAVISYIVDLPFGKGQAIGGDVTGVWTSLCRAGASTASPRSSPEIRYPISVAVNTSNSFGGGQRPNRTGRERANSTARLSSGSINGSTPLRSHCRQLSPSAMRRVRCPMPDRTASPTTTSRCSRTRASPKPWACSSAPRSSISLIACASAIPEPPGQPAVRRRQRTVQRSASDSASPYGCSF